MQFNRVVSEWLKRRQISLTIQEAFHVTAGHHPKLGDCIVIPITDREGNFLFNKYRRSPLSDVTPKYVYDHGAQLTLYGAHYSTDSSTILITEGEMDCLVALSHHIPSVSGTGGALSFKTEWLSYFAIKEVTICFDNDPAGGEGMAKILNLIPTAKILFIPDLPRVKDISDYVASNGNLHELIKSARSFTSMEEVVEDRARRVALFQGTYFHDAYIRNHKPKVPAERKKSGGARIERAKAYPISDLIELKANKTACLWHKEDTPSLHYFRKNNRLYCFGCGKSADAIDIYQELHKVGFKEAVDKLQ